MPDFKLEKSTCGQFVRVTVNGEVTQMSISQWAWFIANPDCFRVEAEGEAEVA